MDLLTKNTRLKKIFDELFIDDDPVVFTTRLRIARNLENYVFPHCITKKDAGYLVDEVLMALRGFQGTFFVVPMAEIDNLTREFFVERHIISPEFAEDDPSKVLILFPEKGIRILVNEEDHLRISICGKKKNLEKMWNILNIFDDNLSRKLNYAFDDGFGYLTSCPTNLGSALRASALLFMPALKMAREIKKIFDTTLKPGYLLRGFYGEGSQSMGNLYQVATGPALGKKEQDIYKDVISIIEVLKQHEFATMEKINIRYIKTGIKNFLDKVYNSNSGIDSQKAIKGISLLLFGKNLGIIKVEAKLLKMLVYRVLPASIQIEAGGALEPEERDLFRVQMLRQELRGAYV
ncbi:MAG TPA: hypothetical protein P5065_03705 [Candidatus Ratteibacteria bacterium]|jgi:protein arginine kinase|uniref:ATP:guanido phosphotransferase n=1 Tax=candidate division TA06 bacterium ADurb.Bin131 TaxID=1852827 RepID=A0A1V6CD81_UNCT6|nr:MAG: putative ATP:guanido phosphotransferase [candidate division TA06 bacterium ADurb.Bin131]HOC03171.1 hypothetical protein [bacterium]HRS06132.1 hypothetical protein [Candidatus Ratteibacteria bacterium]HON05560.1 hypothetical protein [bacterium]HQL64297.1 hypothetical protein [bacterium]